MGSEFHQRVIDTSRDGVEMAGRSNGASWHVLSQVPLSGFRRPDGSPYSMLPDVFVHPKPNPHPASGEYLTFPELGVPLLVIEVLSPGTYRWDIDEERGKAWSYADAGVRELILVDFNQHYLEEPVRALRLEEGRWAPWRPTAEGRWVSAALGVSFAYDHPYLRVYDAEGQLMPLPWEAHELLREQETRLRGRETQLLRDQAALQARLRALLAAGDLAGAQALLAEQDPA